MVITDRRGGSALNLRAAGLVESGLIARQRLAISDSVEMSSFRQWPKVSDFVARLSVSDFVAKKCDTNHIPRQATAYAPWPFCDSAFR